MAAGDTYYNALSGFGDDIARAMVQYHQEHQKYDRALQIADELSRLGVDASGRPVPIQMDEKGKPIDKDIIPAVDPKALDRFRNANRSQWDKSAGALDVLSRLGVGYLTRASAARVEDTSLSGQATRQRITQQETMFPLDVEQKKAQTAHLKKITEDEGKIDVPGFGLMTPSQYSAHTARMERMDVLKKKSEPLLQFENQLQGAYGLGIKDIADATKGKQFQVGKTFGGTDTKTGTPYYDVNGNQVDTNYANRKPEETFVHIGPNNVAIPLFNRKTGLGWTQIAAKANNMASKLDQLTTDQDKLSKDFRKTQAQQVISALSQQDPSTFTPADKAAQAKAQAILNDEQ